MRAFNHRSAILVLLYAIDLIAACQATRYAINEYTFLRCTGVQACRRTRSYCVQAHIFALVLRSWCFGAGARVELKAGVFTEFLFIGYIFPRLHREDAG